MPKRRTYPFRTGYKCERKYPAEAGRFIIPTHGSGPRCRVDHNPNDDGPWSTLQVMRVDEDGEVEEYTCAMPRYYAVPLILINKRLAFVEASCHPDGTPRKLPISSPTPTSINDDDNDGHYRDHHDDSGDTSSSSGGGAGGVVMVTQHDRREYSYLWRLRTGFLQAVFDMNHQRRLDESWRYELIHGFMYRLYRRYGHDDYQRRRYWRDEVKARRVPYSTPDIADMDWESHILENMAGMNAFLWNRISQGYPCVVKDEPPQEYWLAWRRHAANRSADDAQGQKPALFRTPGCTPVREMSRGLAPDPQTQSQSQSQPQSSSMRDPRDNGRALGGAAPPTAIQSTSSGSAAAAANGCCRCAGTINRGDDVETIDSMNYEEVLTGALNGPDTPVWQLPFPALAQSSVAASQSTASTSSQGRRERSQVVLDLNAPDNMRLTVIHCTFARVEDVGEDFERQLKVAYASKLS